MSEQEIREREIEEIARSLGRGSGECVRCSDCDCANYQLAKKLYQACIRKIHENEVVLSKEEYEDLIDQSGMNAIKQLVETRNTIERVREEAAVVFDCTNMTQNEIDEFIGSFRSKGEEK